MPMKACGRAPVPLASGYTQLDTIDGMCTVTFANQTNATFFLVTDVQSAGAAITEESAGRYNQYASAPTAVYTIQCNPARTWIEWQGTTVGTNWYGFIISW